MPDPLYHVTVNGQQTGPFSLSQLRSMWQSGTINAASFYWREGEADWLPITQLQSQLDPLAGATRPPGPPPLAGVARSGRPRTSKLAISSLICGILGFLGGLTSIPAIICGHLSLNRIRHSAGQLTGGGMALAGLILGYLMFVLGFLALLAGIALPVFSAVQERALATKDLAQAKQIGAAIQLYEADHGARSPLSLEDLVPQYLPDPAILISPLDPAHHAVGYELMLPNTETEKIADRKTVLLRGLYPGKGKNGFRSYVYVDRSAEMKREPN